MTEPARTAHGAVYWLLVGWWWGPAKWVGRMLLWIFLFPVGIWLLVAGGGVALGARFGPGPA